MSVHKVLADLREMMDEIGSEDRTTDRVEETAAAFGSFVAKKRNTLVDALLKVLDKKVEDAAKEASALAKREVVSAFKKEQNAPGSRELKAIEETAGGELLDAWRELRAQFTTALTRDSEFADFVSSQTFEAFMSNAEANLGPRR